MNNNENKDKDQQIGNEGETRSKTPTSSKSPFAKRWTFPVIYLAASVLIVGLMYAKSQDAAPYGIDQTGNDVGETAQGPTLPAPTDDGVAAANATPSMDWPVGEGGEDARVSMDFYRDNGTDEDKAAALVVFDNNYIPNQGINLGLQSDAPFEVVAAAKGTVVDVKEDPLMGHTIEIDHGNGFTTYYASLSNVEVKKGAIVLAKQPIAKTGVNRFEKDQQNHLHFEIRKDGVAVDPRTLLPEKHMDNAKSTAKEITSDQPTNTLPDPSPVVENDQPVAGDAKDATKENEQDKTPAGDAKSTTKPAEKSSETPATGEETKKEDASTSTDGTSGAR